MDIKRAFIAMFIAGGVIGLALGIAWVAANTPRLVLASVFMFFMFLFIACMCYFGLGDDSGGYPDA